MTSGVKIIMAGALLRDLGARGVKHLTLGDCEAMIARMFDCICTIEAGTASADSTAPSAAFHGAQCPSYPACAGGCGLGCTHDIERTKR